MAQRVVDLSGPIDPQVWSYNVLPQIEHRLPAVDIERVASVEDQGWEAHRLVLSTCGGGSYIETSAHMIAGRARVAEMNPASFIRPAVVQIVPTITPRALLTARDLEASASDEIRPGDALLVGCGWGARWGTPGYVEECPTWSADAMEWVLAHEIGLLGTDLPCLEAPAEAGKVLMPLMEQDVLLLAPLINLESIQRRRGTVIALPLHIIGVCATPTRAVFLEEEI